MLNAVASISSFSLVQRRLALVTQSSCLGNVSADGALKRVIWIEFTPLMELLLVLLLASWIVRSQMVDLKAGGAPNPHTLPAVVFVLSFGCLYSSWQYVWLGFATHIAIVLKLVPSEVIAALCLSLS